MKSRVLDPFLTHDFWWMGVGGGFMNNWAPWCTANSLVASLLLEADPTHRVATVRKSMEILDRWLATYHPDGGCDEGPTYWVRAGGSLLRLPRTSLRRFSRQDPASTMNPSSRRSAAISPAPASAPTTTSTPPTALPASRLPADLVYRYGRRLNDAPMIALGRWTHHQRPTAFLEGRDLLRLLPPFFFSEGIEEAGEPSLPRDTWLPGTEIMTAREREDSDRGFYLAVKGGHNGESHNHNNVGHFVVYYDGYPSSFDAGVGTYTAQTFSDRRYEIWTMQTAYHNLPTVNGVQQKEGREFHAQGVYYHADDSAAALSLDLAAAYPKAAHLISWHRTCRLIRGDKPRVEIEERFALSAPTQALELSLLTAHEPRLEPGLIRLTNGETQLALTYDPAELSACLQPLDLDDPTLIHYWGNRLWRLLLRATKPQQNGDWRLVITESAD